MSTADERDRWSALRSAAIGVAATGLVVAAWIGRKPALAIWTIWTALWVTLHLARRTRPPRAARAGPASRAWNRMASPHLTKRRSVFPT